MSLPVVYFGRKIESDHSAPGFDLVEDASNIIAANVAGYDRAYREILQNALAKQDENLRL